MVCSAVVRGWRRVRAARMPFTIMCALSDIWDIVFIVTVFITDVPDEQSLVFRVMYWHLAWVCAAWSFLLLLPQLLLQATRYVFFFPGKSQSYLAGEETESPYLVHADGTVELFTSSNQAEISERKACTCGRWFRGKRWRRRLWKTKKKSLKICLIFFFNCQRKLTPQSYCYATCPSRTKFLTFCDSATNTSPRRGKTRVNGFLQRSFKARAARSRILS
jgi:hypothetical protein